MCMFVQQETSQFSYLLCLYLFLIFFFSVGSLHSFGLPSCRNCELVSTSSPSHLQHSDLGVRTTTTTTTTNVTTSSLGLVQLLQERGISASLYPHHHHLHHSQSATPSCSTATDKGGGSSSDIEGRRSVFSLNLVEKLQSLGLHRVAAWGMTGRNEAVRENQSDIL